VTRNLKSISIEIFFDNPVDYCEFKMQADSIESLDTAIAFLNTVKQFHENGRGSGGQI
jgi:hypothetical protein